MTREMRRVPADWSHPVDAHGAYIPLFRADKRADYASEAPEDRPADDAFMPEWTDAEATHYMMYETTTEGTPISPAFATAEELAQWLTDARASVFADQTADFDHWMAVIRGENPTVQAGAAITAH